MTLYEVAILEHPTKKKGKTRLALKPKCILAKSEQQAAINIILDNASSLEGLDRDNMEVLVRPFI